MENHSLESRQGESDTDRPASLHTQKAVNLSLIIPCYNETERIDPTMEEALEFLEQREKKFELIVVDDGSTDGTADHVEQRWGSVPQVDVLRVRPNQGKGNAVREGMLAARGKMRLFADADGATPFREFEKLERVFHEQQADVVVGSRVLNPELVESNWRRRFVGFFFRTLVRFLAVRSVRDTQCGFKLFRAEAADRIFSQQSLAGFAFDVELLFLAERAGYSIREVPIEWHEQAGSKVRVIRDSWRMFRDLLRIRWHHRGRQLPS